LTRNRVVRQVVGIRHPTDSVGILQQITTT
jgi:hypothetical protein